MHLSRSVLLVLLEKIFLSQTLRGFFWCTWCAVTISDYILCHILLELLLKCDTFFCAVISISLELVITFSKFHLLTCCWGRVIYSKWEHIFFSSVYLNLNQGSEARQIIHLHFYKEKFTFLEEIISEYSSFQCNLVFVNITAQLQFASCFYRICISIS